MSHMFLLVKCIALSYLFIRIRFALGAGTALLGKEAAMACTVAVETAITEHYNE